jgi:hypothetical protein
MAGGATPRAHRVRLAAPYGLSFLLIPKSLTAGYLVPLPAEFRAGGTQRDLREELKEILLLRRVPGLVRHRAAHARFKAGERQPGEVTGIAQLRRNPGLPGGAPAGARQFRIRAPLSPHGNRIVCGIQPGMPEINQAHRRATGSAELRRGHRLELQIGRKIAAVTGHAGQAAGQVPASTASTATPVHAI